MQVIRSFHFSAIKHACKCFITLAITKQCFSFPAEHFETRQLDKRHWRQCIAALCQLLADTGSPLHVFRAWRAGDLRCSPQCSITLPQQISAATRPIAQVTSVTTFENWWQLGFRPKFAIETLSILQRTAIPSVCLSHAGIVSKRRHVAQCSLHCQIAKCV